MGKNYNGIDLIKFFCAFLVCIIHIAPFENKGSGVALNFWLQNCFCRLAVPFYFVSSGFFLFRKMPVNEIKMNRVKDYSFKLLRLLGTWSFLLFVGDRWQLWYLGGVVIAVLIISILLRARIKTKYILLLAGLLYIIGLLGDSYYGVLEPIKSVAILNKWFFMYETIFSTINNSLFFGMFFVLIGVLFAKDNIRINTAFSAIGFFALFPLLFLEVYLLKHYSQPRDYNMLILLVPMTIFLFSFASSIRLRDRTIYKRLRIVGELVFFLHLFVYFFVAFINKKLSVLLFDSMEIEFVITIFVTLILSILIEALSRRKKLIWLRYLYS